MFFAAVIISIQTMPGKAATKFYKALGSTVTFRDFMIYLMLIGYSGVLHCIPESSGAGSGRTCAGKNDLHAYLK